jgi:DNA-binding MarR family transcriptional regulator
MIITLTKKQNGKEVLKEFENKYKSIKELERLYKETANPLFLVDYENWKYFKDNPDEELESAVTRVTNKLSLTDMKLEILDFIKNENPKSIRELARFLNKDIKIIHPKVKELEDEGLIELKEGSKNSKIPYLNYDEITIAI